MNAVDLGAAPLSSALEQEIPGRGRSRPGEGDREVDAAVAIAVDRQDCVPLTDFAADVLGGDAEGAEVDLVGAGLEIENQIVAARTALEHERVRTGSPEEAIVAGAADHAVVAPA